MKKLEQHIENLIVRHECIIVPELGGFLTYRDEAGLHGKTLTAPMQRIRFNDMLKYHDGLLAEAYMKDRNASYEEALAAIKADVAAIRLTLEQHGLYRLGNIGALHLGDNGKISMTVSDTGFLPENIGLPVVRLHKLPATEISEIELHNVKRIELTIPRPSVGAMRYAAAIAIIFLISFLIPTSVNDEMHHNAATFSFDTLQNISNTIGSNQTQQAETPTPAETPASGAGETGTKAVSKTETIADIEAATTLKLTDKQHTAHQETHTPQASKSESSSKLKYQLIIASLPNHKSAEQYINTQTNFPASDLAIIEKDGKFRVSARGFSSYNAATAYMDSVRNYVSSAGNAWIMRQ